MDGIQGVCCEEQTVSLALSYVPTGHSCSPRQSMMLTVKIIYNLIFTNLWKVLCYWIEFSYFQVLFSFIFFQYIWYLVLLDHSRLKYSKDSQHFFSFLQQLLIQCLLHVRHCLRHWAVKVKKINKIPTLMKYLCYWCGAKTLNMQTSK